MKLNNKGFALTSIIYMLIVLFLMIMLLVLANLATRKVVLDKIKTDVKDRLGQGGIEQLKIRARDLYYEGNQTQCKNIQCTIDELTLKLNGGVPDSNQPRAITLIVGDVVKMTPTLNTYTTDTTYTGASSTQTINPQLLNTWRVIRVNDNGTYDAISEYASYETITFKGANAYTYYIYYLNILASKYINDNYTVGSRYMGYNGQTQTIEDTSYYSSGKTAGTKWQGSTSSSTTADEPSGRGDIKYSTDVDLVKIAHGNKSYSLKAYAVDQSGNPTSTTVDYWLASRFYGYYSSSLFDFDGRYISSDGYVIHGAQYTRLREYNSAWKNNERSHALRPIITLKSDLTATGNGTIASPYILQ